LDIDSIAFPTPLAAQTPAGSLIYSGSFNASIGFGGDTDNIILNLDAPATLTVVVTPSSTLRPSLSVTGPGTNLVTSASAAGGIAQIQTIPITTAAPYTFTVGAVSGTGTYTIAVTLNTTNEAESAGGPSNDTPATAQDLIPALLNLP